MSLYYYINNESVSKKSINDYDYIFNGFITETPTLIEALMQMFTSSGVSGIKSKKLINEIMSKVNVHLNKKKNEICEEYPNISFEEAQIITSYTCELSNREDSNYNIYKILNRNLVSEDRESGIKVIAKYLFIFLKSLRKLKRYYPNKESKYLYRCISTKVELNKDSFDKNKIPYLRGETKIFWAFSSASKYPQESYNFLGAEGNNKIGTIFTLTGDVWGYDISLFNVFNENEILLEPERKIKIKESIPPINDIIHVRCKILQTPIVLEKIINIKKNNLYNYNVPDLNSFDNLNINEIINEKKGISVKTSSKQKILFHSNSDKKMINNKNYYNYYNNLINDYNNNVENQVKFKNLEILNTNLKDNYQNKNIIYNQKINNIKKDNNHLLYTPNKKDTQSKIYDSDKIITTNSYNPPNSSKYSTLTYNNKYNISNEPTLSYSNSEKNIFKNANIFPSYNFNNNNNLKDNYVYNSNNSIISNNYQLNLKQSDNINVNKKIENNENLLMTPIKKNTKHIISYSNNIQNAICYTEPNSSKYSSFPINTKKNIINSNNIKISLKTTNNETKPNNNNNYFCEQKNNNKITSTKILNNNNINDKKYNSQYPNNYNYKESIFKKINKNNIIISKKENNNNYQPNLFENKNNNIENNQNYFGLIYSNSDKKMIKNNNFDNLNKDYNIQSNSIKKNDCDELKINKVISNKKETIKPININNKYIKYTNNLKKPSYNQVPLYKYDFK